MPCSKCFCVYSMGLLWIWLPASVQLNAWRLVTEVNYSICWVRHSPPSHPFPTASSLILVPRAALTFHRSGIVVSMLASINEVNLCRTRLVLRWATGPCPGSIPGAGHLFQYVTNQPPKANSAFHRSGVGKWVPASVGKAKAGMVHSVSGWTVGCAGKTVRSLENACHTWVP